MTTFTFIFIHRFPLGLLLSPATHSSCFQFPQFCFVSARWLGSHGYLTVVAMVTRPLKCFCSVLSSLPWKLFSPTLKYTLCCLTFTKRCIEQFSCSWVFFNSNLLKLCCTDQGAARSNRLRERKKEKGKDGWCCAINRTGILSFYEEKYNVMCDGNSKWET